MEKKWQHVVNGQVVSEHDEQHAANQALKAAGAGRVQQVLRRKRQ